MAGTRCHRNAGKAAGWPILIADHIRYTACRLLSRRFAFDHVRDNFALQNRDRQRRLLRNKALTGGAVRRAMAGACDLALVSVKLVSRPRLCSSQRAAGQRPISKTAGRALHSLSVNPPHILCFQGKNILSVRDIAVECGFSVFISTDSEKSAGSSSGFHSRECLHYHISTCCEPSGLKFE